MYLQGMIYPEGMIWRAVYPDAGADITQSGESGIIKIHAGRALCVSGYTGGSDSAGGREDGRWVILRRI